ncbi:MAG: hypothetical protein IH899_05785, partial [Planctomycetes bacterium]|nr:hypothetical protein [Planctomycetota bacterium]
YKIELAPTLKNHWYSVHETLKSGKEKFLGYVPSSTTVLLAFPQSEQLTKWIAEKGYSEAQRIKSEKGESGSLIHAACDLLEDGRCFKVSAVDQFKPFERLESAQYVECLVLGVQRIGDSKFEMANAGITCERLHDARESIRFVHLIRVFDIYRRIARGKRLRLLKRRDRDRFHGLLWLGLSGPSSRK